ncbi:MAG: UvrD-helicase domain-containing protein [Pseudomonadota bacterium]
MSEKFNYYHDQAVSVVGDPDISRQDQNMPPYMQGLNKAQYDAVNCLDAPLLVLAGAGTGKTRVLTTRIAHILYSGLARPWEVLAVTFTNKAAKEMQERVGSLLGGMEAMSWTGTFHAIAAKILRRHAPAVGLQSSFTILNDDDQERLLKQILEAGGEDLKRSPAKFLLSIIDSWKNRGYTPKDVPFQEIPDIYGGRALEYYEMYQDRLRTLNAVDFGDLLLHNITLFKAQPEILRDYHRRFKFILVDEYQDTNIAQYLWLRLLAQGHGSICCVGDDDQSIYGWRGAEVGNILKFERDFDGAKIIRLEQNYRSTSVILEAASGLISHNQGRLGKSLYSDTQGGEPIILKTLWDGEEEARYISEIIEDIERSKEPPLSDVAILVRTSSQMRVLEERLITCAIPYRVIGGMKFYERAEIRDALAYMRLIAQPHDDLAFERVLNKPKRGLGDATVKILRETARQMDGSIYLSTQKVIETGLLRPKARGALETFMQNLTTWIAASAKMPVSELAGLVLDESGYMQMLKDDKSPDVAGRIENLKELVKSMQDYETLSDFLEHVALVMDNNAPDTLEKVTIMTLHAAKGLEFHTVFLPGWEDGLFPSQKTMDESGNKGLEEERRLAYVALTRARKQIYLSFAQNRRLYNQWQSTLPSRFIDEIPETCLQSERQSYFNQPKSTLSHFENSGSAYDTPGWKRARENFIEHNPYEAPKRRAPREASHNFTKGDHIVHGKFGYGEIISAEGDRLLVRFEEEGFKNVFARFVEMA